MDIAVELKAYNDSVFKEKIDRIYFADSFCQNLIPAKKELEKIYKTAKDNGIQFTMNTPYATDAGIKQLLDNIETIYKYEESFEITFNDWGVFYEVKKRFPKIKQLLGRLLTKQRTDPNSYAIITNSQKISADKGITLKKIPEELFRHFQSSVINDAVFQKYLTGNNIDRVEIEYLAWDMELSLPENIKASVYYPYAHITTTRNCGLLNMTYSKCNKMCNDVMIKYEGQDMLFPYFVIGNTVFYKVKNLNKIHEYQCIDRIVFNDLEAFHNFGETI